MRSDNSAADDGDQHMQSDADEQDHPPDAVDIPVTVPPEVAEDMADDLEQKGYIDIRVKKGNSPNIVEQIRWQLENGKPALKFVDEYEG